MSFYEDNDNQSNLTFGWWFAFTVAWVIWMFACGQDAYAQQYADASSSWNQMSGWDQFWHSDKNPSQVGIHVFFAYLFYSVLGAIVAVMPAQIIAAMQFSAGQEANTRRKKLELQATLDQMSAKSEATKQAMEVEQIQKELIDRLDQIDSYILVLEAEKDSGKRTIARQKALSEMAELEKIRLANKIPPKILTNSVLVSHAKATIAHLGKIGTDGDRLRYGLQAFFATTA